LHPRSTIWAPKPRFEQAHVDLKQGASHHEAFLFSEGVAIDRVDDRYHWDAHSIAELRQVKNGAAFANSMLGLFHF
jgi:hypothetical protein